jgi:hypothetical protein
LAASVSLYPDDRATFVDKLGRIGNFDPNRFGRCLRLCILCRSHKFNQRVDVVCLGGDRILRSDQVRFCGLIQRKINKGGADNFDQSPQMTWLPVPTFAQVTAQVI